MSPELEDKFYECFPELFRGRYKPIEESLMSFGFSDCSDERFSLLWQNCIAIEQVANRCGIDRHGEEWPEAMQVKEKLGTLRFHICLRHEKEEMRELRQKLVIDSAGGDESLL